MLNIAPILIKPFQTKLWNSTLMQPYVVIEALGTRPY